METRLGFRDSREFRLVHGARCQVWGAARDVKRRASALALHPVGMNAQGLRADVPQSALSPHLCGENAVPVRGRAAWKVMFRPCNWAGLTHL